MPFPTEPARENWMAITSIGFLCPGQIAEPSECRTWRDMTVKVGCVLPDQEIKMPQASLLVGLVPARSPKCFTHTSTPITMSPCRGIQRGNTCRITSPMVCHRHLSRDTVSSSLPAVWLLDVARRVRVHPSFTNFVVTHIASHLSPTTSPCCPTVHVSICDFGLRCRSSIWCYQPTVCPILM